MKRSSQSTTSTRAKRTKTPAARALTKREDINNRLFFRLFQASNIYQVQAVRQLNVSAIQGAVLGALSRDPDTGMSVSSLYTYLSVSRQNLNVILNRLADLDLVERVEGTGDRRVRYVRLTPTGHAAWQDIFEKTIEFYRQGTAGMTHAEVAACAESLARICRGLKGPDTSKTSLAKGAEADSAF